MREEFLEFCIGMRIESCRKNSLTFHDEILDYSAIQYSLHL